MSCKVYVLKISTKKIKQNRVHAISIAYPNCIFCYKRYFEVSVFESRLYLFLKGRFLSK